MKQEESSQVDRPGAVSIRSVADRAGVSIATVSRVLNTPQKVSKSTAARVRAAIEELEYRPNLFAKGLLTKRSRVIGVSLPDIHGEFYSELMCALDDRACELGYHLLVSSNAHRLERGAGNGFALDLVDGLIVMLTERSGIDLDGISKLNQPVVVIGVDEPGLDVDTITVDNRTGARRAVEHLLEHGSPERCYFVGAHRGNIDSDERLEAFCAALRKRGHEPQSDQIARKEFSFDWGWEWAESMIDQGLLRDAAVFAANDEIAIGIANAARDLGVEIPGSLRLVGFDDSRLCSLLRPKLSSVRMPVREIGHAAIESIIRRIEEPESTPRHARLATAFVQRDSSGLPWTL
ncbi:MAG: LacI family DNA-binding transcriptional regulator [Phycisphaerales bacterium JB052]